MSRDEMSRGEMSTQASALAGAEGFKQPNINPTAGAGFARDFARKGKFDAGGALFL